MKQKKAFSALWLIALGLTVCSPCFAAGRGNAAVQPGEDVRLDFVCRFQNGEIAAASAEDVTKDASQKKSDVFRPREKFDAVTVRAGGGSAEIREQGEGWFEGEIIVRLAERAEGMKRGERNRVELKADDIRPQGGQEAIEVARFRQRPKEMRMTPEEFRFRFGREPKAGETLALYDEIPGKVAAVKEDEVLVTFAAAAGDEVQTPFGKGVIRDSGSRWDIVIDARRGALVRTGNRVGRIVDFDEFLIKIDYTHPFGGESLVCDVDVEALQEKK